MNVNLSEIRSLSDGLGKLSDGRPEWIRNMPYSMETPTHYHRFLWEFCGRFQPRFVVEIGIDKAGSTMAMAKACAPSPVFSIDINEQACVNARKIAQDHDLANLTAIHNDSIRSVETIRQVGLPIDMLFIDGAHDFIHSYDEYQQYRKLVVHGGIIFFDDIHDGAQMEASWSCVRDPKTELPMAHATGFGVCKVDRSVECPALKEILPQMAGKF